VGDRILLYTDGVIEARDEHRDFVDLFRLAERLAHGPLDLALDGILDSLHRAVGRELGDDVALLAAEYDPR
jgi:serine phosphatase RsbU (regulator of sigma subunit)